MFFESSATYISNKSVIGSFEYTYKQYARVLYVSKVPIKTRMKNEDRIRDEFTDRSYCIKLLDRPYTLPLTQLPLTLTILAILVGFFPLSLDFNFNINAILSLLGPRFVVIYNNK